jgi:hypothetical protein
MKERYIVKVKNISTGVVRVREMLLDGKQYESLKYKRGKNENGYQLVEIFVQ